MSAALEYLIAAYGGVLFRSELARHGLAGNTLLRAIGRGEWRRAGRWLLVHASAPDNLLTQTIVASRLNPDAIITGPSAAVFNPHPAWAGQTFDGQRPMLVGPRSTSPLWREVRHPGAEAVDRLGFRVADPHTTLVDLLRFLPFPDAAAVAGAANQYKLTTHARLDESVAALAGMQGAAQLQVLVGAMRAGAESGPEVSLQQALRRAGIRGWVANRTILVGDRTLLRPDIVFPGEMVAIEYDGVEAHSSEDAFHHDRERICGMVFGRWLLLPVTKRTLNQAPRSRAFLVDLRQLLKERRVVAAGAAKLRGTAGG